MFFFFSNFCDHACSKTLLGITAGKWDVKIQLRSEEDIDLSLFDMTDTETYAEGTAIVNWCIGVCNSGFLGMAPGAKEATYKGMRVQYSGFNGA